MFRFDLHFVLSNFRTRIVVVLSILIFGGTTPAALRRLKIRTGVVDNEDEGDVGVSTTVLSDTAISPPYSRRAAEHWFLSFDNRYVRPVFTHVKWRQPARRELFSESEAHASTELRETRVDSSHGDLATSLQAADQSSRNASRPKTSGRADSPSRKQRTTTRDQLTETEGESDAHDEQVALRTGGKLSARVRSGSAENE